LRENVDPSATVETIRDLSREQAGIYALRYFWTFSENLLGQRSLDIIDSQEVANKVFDLRFNMGPRTGVRLLQRALRNLGFDLRDDGIFGPRTEAETNHARPHALLEQLRREAVDRYVDIARVSHPFLRGWLRRAIT
jgi:lysozyme family protein